MNKIILILIVLATLMLSNSHVAASDSNSNIFWQNFIEESHKILYTPIFMTQFKNNYRSESLYAKLVILQYPQSPNKSLNDLKSLSNNFYQSLALGGIVSIEQKLNPQEAEKLYIDALNKALKIDHYTGSDASSMNYLFQLIPYFKDTQIQRLLDLSWKILDDWEDSPTRKSRAMLTLSQITTDVRPSLAKEILLDKALKSNHYWDSIEVLSVFLYKNSPNETLKIAQEYYDTSKNWPMCNDFLIAVLVAHARDNFNDTFERIKKMRELDKAIVCMKLSKKLVADGQKRKAIKILDYLDSLVKSNISRPDNAVYVHARGLSIKLRREIKEGKENNYQSDIILPETIDEFLKQPNLSAFNEIIKSDRISNKIQFRNKKQVEKFISKGLPYAKKIRDRGYPHHGSPRSIAIGTLALIAAKINSPELTMNIAREISIPELRAFYLMEAYEINTGLLSVTKVWPLRFLRHKVDINMLE